MLPKWHILSGAIFSLILYFFFNVSLLNSLIVFLASVLIDMDHYSYYIIKKRNWNLKKAQDFFKESRRLKELLVSNRKKYEDPLLIFHGIEFWILLILFSFINRIFFWIFLGSIFHMLFDFIDLAGSKIPFYTKISQLYTWRKNKNKQSLLKLIG